MVPDATDITTHTLPLAPVFAWAIGGIGVALSAIYGIWMLWHRSEITTLKEGITDLKDSIGGLVKVHEEQQKQHNLIHEVQEKRFDERERALRHDLGAQNAITMSAQQDLNKKYEKMMEVFTFCQQRHDEFAVRRSDLDGLRGAIDKLTDEFIDLKDSVLQHHAAEDERRRLAQEGGK